MTMSRYAQWKASRRRFPVKWLTYKARVRDDIDRVFQTEDGRSFFDEKYLTALSESTRTLERWEVKLLIFQFSISLFILIGLISSETSISVFGVTLKQMPGLKEIFLALSATLAVIVYAISQSKTLRLIVIEKITELKTNEKFLIFAKLASPAPYEMVAYITRQHDRWVFSTALTKSIMIAIGLLSIFIFVALLGFSIGLWIFLYLEILSWPTLGGWSYLILSYSSIAYALCILWLIRAHLPLPFRDMQALKELKLLREADPASYAVRVRQLYG